MIRTVCLDVGWTMAFPRRSIWEIFSALCAEAGVAVSADTCERLVRGVTAAHQPEAVAQFWSGARYPDSDADFVTNFAALGTLVFSQVGVPEPYDQLLQVFMQQFWHEENWERFDDVLNVLCDLRSAGIRIGVLSNAPTNLPSFLDRLGIAPYLDFAVVSAVEGAKKPDPRIFAAAQSRAGTAPAEILHIGDMYLEDILGGSAAGFQTLLVERGARSLFPHFRESEGRDLAPQLVINELTEIHNYLR